MTMVNSGSKGLIIKTFKIWVAHFTNMSNFHPLEIVGRGSETQPQVGEKFNKIAQELYMGQNSWIA